MRSLNKVSLLGYVGADPEVRYMQNGCKIAKFPLATKEYWKNKDNEPQVSTEWHRIVVFNEGLSNLIEKYVKKGSPIYLEGSIKSRKFLQDNVEKNIIEIVVGQSEGKIILLENKNNNLTNNDGDVEF